ncbi:hypothetical protein [Bradyrhizobium sp. JYMT SZCCT0180]|nr:hypothetical protein [Bradyrhizobium sp. JYMT SZCCT0180]MBR1212336.1 hypothetical protein [Bradyrhizobium sp. JYMT SZCCT0180]
MAASQALSLHRKDTLGARAGVVKKNLYSVKITQVDRNNQVVQWVMWR